MVKFMDRQQAAIHYISQAEIALKTCLEWCKATYGTPAADQLSRLLTNTLFSENLAAYTEPGEVLSLWGVISRSPITEKVYGGEFIMMLFNQFSMYVEPAVVDKSESPTNVNNLTALGKHLVSAIARAHPLVKYPETEMHVELANFNSFLTDLPTPEQVIAILSYFPWIAPLYLLMFSQPGTLKSVLHEFQINSGSTPNGTGA